MTSNTANPLMVKLLTFVIVIAAWEIAGRFINPLFLSSPSAIFQAFVELVWSGELVSALLSSITAFLIGMALAIVVGIAIGVAMGRVRIVELILEPYVTALYSTPSIALIPLFILWFGVGLTAKAFIIFFLSIFIIVINTFTGVKNLSQSIVDVGAAFGANERQAFWMIVLPAALPFIMTGLQARRRARYSRNDRCGVFHLDIGPRRNDREIRQFLSNREDVRSHSPRVFAWRMRG